MSGSLIGGGAPVVDNFSSYPHMATISHVVRSTAATTEPISSRIVIFLRGVFITTALTRIRRWGGWGPPARARLAYDLNEHNARRATGFTVRRLAP